MTPGSPGTSGRAGFPEKGQRAFHLGSTGAWAAVLIFLAHVGLLDFLEHRVVRAFEFRVRDALGHSPALDPRLKAYALDDGTAAMIGGVRVSTTDWLRIFRALAANHPRAVIVDGMFSSNQDVTAAQHTGIRALGDLGTPLVVGALLTPGTIRYRSPVPPERFRAVWTGDGKATGVRTLAGASAYGPTPLFQDAFHFVGHIVQNWPARFAPAVRIGAGTVVPHIALFGANIRTLTETGVAVDGVDVPLDRDGLTAINFLPPDTAASRVKTLSQVIQKARDGEPIKAVDKDDVVLIINNYSTGNTDILDSPFGPVPGGYIILSIINSVMSGQWLRKLDAEEPFILAFAALGTLIGYLSPSFLFWIVLGTAGALHLGLSLLAFTYASTMVPWLFPLTGMVGTGLTAYALQRYNETKRRLHLEMEVATASALQQNFFPAPEFDHEKFSLAAFYRPADAVGGDWYNYGIYGGRWLHLHLGDVTGHGTSAALLASFAKGATDMIYQDYKQRGLDSVPIEVLHNNLNDVLGQGGGKLAMMTLLSIAIDLETGEAYCLNSGHRPALVLNSDHSIISVVTRRESTILGFLPLPKTMTAARHALKGDELILVLSDGLLDVPTHRGRKINDRHLKKLLQEFSSLPPAAIRARLAEELGLASPRRGGDQFIDDVTFLVVKLRLHGAQKLPLPQPQATGKGVA